MYDLFNVPGLHLLREKKKFISDVEVTLSGVKSTENSIRFGKELLLQNFDRGA
jgi:hypothetical protein